MGTLGLNGLKNGSKISPPCCRHKSQRLIIFSRARASITGVIWEKLAHTLSLCTGKTIAAHSEEVWLPVKRTDFRWIRTTSFLVVLNLLSVDFFVKISKSLPNKRCLLYYALTLVEVFQCFPETPCITEFDRTVV